MPNKTGTELFVSFVQHFLWGVKRKETATIDFVCCAPETLTTLDQDCAEGMLEHIEKLQENVVT